MKTSRSYVKVLLFVFRNTAGQRPQFDFRF